MGKIKSKASPQANCPSNLLQGCHISWTVGKTGKYESLYYKMLEVDEIKYLNTFIQVSVELLQALKTISFMYFNNIVILKIQF